MKPNLWLVAVALLLILSGIAAPFWQQELQYKRPTPVAVLPGQRVVPAPAGTDRKPLLLHFSILTAPARSLTSST